MRRRSGAPALPGFSPHIDMRLSPEALPALAKPKRFVPTPGSHRYHLCIVITCHDRTYQGAKYDSF
jgi:hypothetical protein